MSKIAILTKELDFETNSVMNWISALDRNAEIIRINGLTEDSGVFIDLDKEIKLKGVKLSEFDKIWFRKYPNVSVNPTEDTGLNQSISNQLSQEGQAIYRAISGGVDPKNTIGSLNPMDNNKLDNLLMASSIGMLIPRTQIISRKADLINFVQDAPYGVIAKSISNTIFINYKEQVYGMYTEAITDEIIAQLPDRFRPSLFQYQIQRKYEVRAFLLKDELFASAICNSVEVDIRKRTSGLNERIVPIELGEDLTFKIKQLMKELKVDCGSLDLIVDHAGETYFLEVNPFGQLKKYSNACNFRLEKQIALKLIGNE